jgi:hypothetical protein
LEIAMKYARITILTALALVTAASTTITADEACCVPGGCATGADLICRPVFEPAKIEKDCFDIECVPVCIPAIHFPWSKCGEYRCGQVIMVKKLKKRSYECGETYETKWKIEPAACGVSAAACAPCAPGMNPAQPAPPTEALPPAPAATEAPAALLQRF